jgi:hypothetical protein
MRLNGSVAIFLATLAILSFTNCPAEDAKYSFPDSCKPDGFQFRNNELVLNPGSEQGLYLFYNDSANDVWLNHSVGKDPGASAGWASNLNTGNWSAFAINKDNFALTCSESEPGAVKELSCDKVLKVCKFAKPYFKPEETGSYWVSEDKPLTNVLGEIKSRGIEF